MESAYRQVPVHPDDRPLLGMKWRDRIYVDAALPFGLRSALKIFNAVADALHWILQKESVDSLHYLDDYFLVGAPNSQDYGIALRKTIQLCSRLGVPIATQDERRSSTVLTFLGNELDTLNGILRLPSDKLTRLRHEIVAWSTKRWCSKQDLLSLIGQLQHACCVVKPGRSFLRRMIQLSTVAKELHHHIRLNAGFRSDLKWWACLLTSWNGIGMMSSQGAWFRFSWPPLWTALHITVKEFLPIVLAVAMWGHQWQGKVVRRLCDNAAVVAVIRSGTSKDTNVMHLIRSLFFFAAKYNLILLPVHLPGLDNSAADALSRNDLSLLSLSGSISTTPTRPNSVRVAPSTGATSPGLDIASLGELVHKFFSKGLAQSTLRSYNSGQIWYLSFCDGCNVSPLPASEEVLCMFASHLAESGLKHRTIKSYLSAIRFLHISEGASDPFQASLTHLDYVLLGIKKNEVEKGTGSRERLPISPQLLRKIKELWDHSSSGTDIVMLWAACCLAFFGFLRAGELTVPSDSGCDASVHLPLPPLSRLSLSNPKRTLSEKGSAFFWEKPTPISAQSTLCLHLLILGQNDGPLFIFRDGRFLTRQRLIEALRFALAQTGVDDSKYSGHSFRIGAATTAASRGFEDCIIKTLGRWSSLAYLEYVKIPRVQLAEYSRALVS